MIYDARLVHVRHQRVARRFTSRLRPWLVDLDALPHRPPFATFEARDHLGHPDRTIRRNVEDWLTDHGIDPPGGPILMLTTPRTLGYAFNPLTVFWCHDPSGEPVATIAEVHNTYGEHHCYLLHPDSDTAKEFYVSPFLEVAGSYRMRLPPPTDRLTLSVVLHHDGRRLLTAALTGHRAGPPTWHRLLRDALQPHRVRALIQCHGVALWLRGLPVQPRHAGGLPAPPRSPVRALVAERLFRRAVAGMPVRVRLPGGELLGRGGDDAPAMSIERPEFFHRLGARTTIGLGEAYMAGDWTSEDPAAVLTPFAARAATVVPRPLRPLRRFVDVRRPLTDRNTTDGARANIRRHYDLSNDLFAAFLDESMTYSCAWFEPGEDLHAAQLRKIDSILDLAGVGPDTRLLEIGTGWGALAIRAAGRGARVTTLTISTEQRDLALAQVAEAGVADRVDVELRDYREATGRFDAVVSVEMIEAVGAEFWPVYFATLDRVLTPGGRVALQAITLPHSQLLATLRSHTWINEYVFPGGRIPSVPAIEHQVNAHTALAITARRRLGEHYARTLRCWRERFLAADITSLGFDETFRRQWEFYLSYCEAGFASGYLDVWQFQLTKPGAGATPSGAESP